MYAAAGRGGRRADIDAVSGRPVRVERRHGTREKLADVLYAAVDVAADVVGIVRLESGGRGRCGGPARGRGSRARTARSGPRCARSCRMSSRWARGSTPRRCACLPGARVGSNRLCCAVSTKGRSAGIPCPPGARCVRSPRACPPGGPLPPGCTPWRARAPGRPGRSLS